MKEIQISEQRYALLKEELKELREKIDTIKIDTVSEEQGLFKPLSTGSILYDLIRWDQRAKSVKQITLSSPISKAILRKKIGETFQVKGDKNQLSFDETITGIVKAKDIEEVNKKEEETFKKPYTLT